MKKFEIKQTDILVQDQKQTYKDLIMACLNQTPKEGFSFEEMTSRLNIATKLKDTQAGDTVDFEDAEGKKINECVDRMRWAFMDPHLVQFTNDVKSFLI